MHNALGVLDRAAKENGFDIQTHTLSENQGQVDYLKNGTVAATLLWNISERCADAVTVGDTEVSGSGALVALRKFLAGDAEWNAPSGAIESGENRAWYAGTA